jgi:hypothetical protein
MIIQNQILNRKSMFRLEIKKILYKKIPQRTNRSTSEFKLSESQFYKA